MNNGNVCTSECQNFSCANFSLGWTWNLEHWYSALASFMLNNNIHSEPEKTWQFIFEYNFG